MRRKAGVLLACVCLMWVIVSASHDARAQSTSCSLKEFEEDLRDSLQAKLESKATSDITTALNSCASSDPRYFHKVFEFYETRLDRLANLASILSVIKSPWRATDDSSQEKWRSRLYAAFRTSSTENEKLTLNAALMNADDLYGGALRNFQRAPPGSAQYQGVERSLKRTLEYTESPNFDDARFLLGSFFLRELVYKRLKPTASLPSEDTIVANARGYFQGLVEDSKSSPPKYVMASQWNLAILQLLTGKRQDAVKSLANVEEVYKSAFTSEKRVAWNHTLYFNRIFYCLDLPVVNSHVTYLQAATELRLEIEKNMIEAPSWPTPDAMGVRNVSALIESTFSRSKTYFVLLGAHRTRREAEESLRTTRQSLDDSTLKDKLMVYPPWADRQVYSTGTTLMSIVEARRLINDERKRFPPSAAVTRFY